MSVMICPVCGGKHRAGFTECVDCGVELVESPGEPDDRPADPPMAVMVCPVCGSEHRLGFRECSDCGVPLVEAIPDEGGPPPEAHGPWLVERLERLSLVRRILLVYLLLSAALSGLGAYTLLVRLRGFRTLYVGVLAGSVIIGTLLPVVAAYATLLELPWARKLTFVYLALEISRTLPGAVVFPFLFGDALEALGAGTFNTVLSWHFLVWSVIMACLLWREGRRDRNDPAL